MKIIHYMLGFRSRDGGVVRAVIDLSNVLARRGHDVIALTTDGSDAPADWDGREGRPLLRALSFNKIGQGVLTRTAKAQAEQTLRGADVLHLHVPWDLICVQMARLARTLNVPYFMSVHGMLDDWCFAQKSWKKRLYMGLVGRRMLEQAAAVHCMAQAEREQVQRRFSHC